MSSALPSTSSSQSHLLAQVEADLSFLLATNHLSSSNFDRITSLLPSSSASAVAASISNLSLSAKPSPPPLPARVGSSERERAAGTGPGRKCRALWDYSSQEASDLSFPKGAEIDLEDTTNHEWWSGSFEGRKGFFPATHVELLTQPSPTSHLQKPSQPLSPSSTSFARNPSHRAFFIPPPPPLRTPSLPSSSHAPSTQLQQSPQDYVPDDQPPNQNPTNARSLNDFTQKNPKLTAFGKMMATRVAMGAGVGVGIGVIDEIF